MRAGCASTSGSARRSQRDTPRAPENYHTWSHEGYGPSNDSIANATSYANLVEHNRSIVRDMCLDLAKKLDAVGLLNDCLIVCPQEHNQLGHQSWNVPVITFGSAGGVLATGKYIDYRDFASGNDTTHSRFGFPMNQLLANVLRAMDVAPAQFEPLNKKWGAPFKPMSGYGVSQIDNAVTNTGVFDDHYSAAKWSGHDLSEWLPALKA